jgi:hypothetical protein
MFYRQKVLLGLLETFGGELPGTDFQKYLFLYTRCCEKDHSNEFVPYKFSYRLADEKGKESPMMIEDWELGALYWNCFRRHNGSEPKAIEDVRKKYLDDFAVTKDLYLFLGTTLKYDGWAQNPFVIIGTFTPPVLRQQGLF